MAARIEGAREAADWLGAIAGRLRDPSPALRVEGERMRAEAERAIADRRAPDGTEWPEPRRTTERGGSRGRARTATRSSGRLARSGRVAVDGELVVVEFTAPYAGFVQDGTEDMEARPFLPFAGDEPIEAGSLVGLEERVGDWIVGGGR
jgi:phage gpG-like protein